MDPKSALVGPKPISRTGVTPPPSVNSGLFCHVLVYLRVVG